MENLIEFYGKAKDIVVDSGYSWEIEWQESRNQEKISESEYLREYAWVILCSGFRESTIRKIFDSISLCFCDWESSEEIVRNEIVCKETALKVFGNKRKIDAIIKMSQILAEMGFSTLRENLASNPKSTLIAFPYIGEITYQHLLKNLGFEIAKSDRHLVKLASDLGVDSVADMCSSISKKTGESVNIIDIVLWRYMTLRPLLNI
ncbi:MAG: hypothetical protein GKR93_12570 [Gammaproteobacteria bacterium]|nr:hypothetical protein [Gammaproteobacteria bacterium]